MWRVMIKEGCVDVEGAGYGGRCRGGGLLYMEKGRCADVEGAGYGGRCRCRGCWIWREV